MKSKILHHDGVRTVVLIFEQGDEVMIGLRQYAREHRVKASRLQAIGAFREVTLGYFDWERKVYHEIPIHEQLEVLSMIGNVTVDHGELKVHAHVVLGRMNGTTRGGHLLQGHVRPTLEVVLTETPAYLQREEDAESGLALLAV